MTKLPKIIATHLICFNKNLSIKPFKTYKFFHIFLFCYSTTLNVTFLFHVIFPNIDVIISLSYPFTPQIVRKLLLTVRYSPSFHPISLLYPYLFPPYPLEFPNYNAIFPLLESDFQFSHNSSNLPIIYLYQFFS